MDAGWTTVLQRVRTTEEGGACQPFVLGAQAVPPAYARVLGAKQKMMWGVSVHCNTTDPHKEQVDKAYA